MPCAIATVGNAQHIVARTKTLVSIFMASILIPPPFDRENTQKNPGCSGVRSAPLGRDGPGGVPGPRWPRPGTHLPVLHDALCRRRSVQYLPVRGCLLYTSPSPRDS